MPSGCYTGAASTELSLPTHARQSPNEHERCPPRGMSLATRQLHSGAAHDAKGFGRRLAGAQLAVEVVHEVGGRVVGHSPERHHYAARAGGEKRVRKSYHPLAPHPRPERGLARRQRHQISVEPECTNRWQVERAVGEDQRRRAGARLAHAGVRCEVEIAVPLGVERAPANESGIRIR